MFFLGKLNHDNWKKQILLLPISLKAKQTAVNR